MSAPGLQREIPPEYRDTVELLLREEPAHRADGDDAEPKAAFSFGSFVRPYRRRLLVGFAIVVAATAASNVGPLIFAKAIDRGIVGHDFQLLLLLALLYLGTVLLRVVLRRATITYVGAVGQDLLYRLRNRVFDHLQQLSYEYHGKTRSGHTLAILTNDINTLSSLLQDGLINFVVQGLVLIMIGVVLLSMNAVLALILLTAVVPPMMLVTFWFRQRSGRIFKKARARGADIVADLHETLYGLKQIRIFNRAAVNIRTHEAAILRYQQANDDSAGLTSLYSAMTDFVEVGAQCVVLFIGYRFVTGGTLTFGQLIAFALFLKRFFAPLEQLALSFRDYQAARAALDKIARFLAMPAAIGDAPAARPLRVHAGAVRMVQVSHAYEEGCPALSGVDLDIRPGEHLSIVGATGSGKSTLVKLLCRLLEPATGRIEIDGQDITSVTLASLRARVGVIQQDAILFHGSLRDNLTFANPNATPAQIEAACRTAQLQDVIARLPSGLDSSVYGQGESLSAGERQLVAIARLLLMDPAIIVMDEATSHLDPKTELLIEKAMQAVSKNRTTIVVSHRLDRSARFDRIVVMQAGRVLESGPHAELAVAGGAYAEMIRCWETADVQ